jgi:hypothetical protein
MKLKFSTAVLALLMVSGAAFAETAAGAAAADTAHALTVRTFTFKYKQADKAAAAIKALVSADGSVSIQPATNSLVVTDRAENLKSIVKAIGDFDLPAQTFKLSVRLIAAGHAEGNPRVGEDLKDVAQKLSMLRYNSFEGAGEALVEGKEGDPGIVEMPTGYRADFGFGEFDPATDSIKVKDFHLSRLGGAAKDQLATVLAKTSLNLRLGQMYIVGAAKAPDSQRALMIVLVARR